MSVITATQEVEAFLRQAKERTEIVSPNGKPLGYFVPDSEEAIYERVKALIDPEELARRAAEGPTGLTIEQVRERLRSLEDTA